MYHDICIKVIFVAMRSRQNTLLYLSCNNSTPGVMAKLPDVFSCVINSVDFIY